MELKAQNLQALMDAPGFDPEQQGARFWYEAYVEQRQQLEKLQAELAALEEKLNKLNQRTSENSSTPPSQDIFKRKKSKGFTAKVGKKRGPKYNHPGTTRNGFEQVDEHQDLPVTACPVCSAPVECIPEAPVRRHQIAELVNQPIRVTEYERRPYQCPVCGWQGYAPLPLGCREDFSYGALLSSLVGWLGYGGHLSWGKQRYLVETILGVPLSQGSLAKMHQWFCRSLYPSYEQWWGLIQTPGVRCVDETSYRLNGVNYWLWVATSPEVCVLFFAPTRSSAEVKSLLGEDFSGILSSDCWSAYGPQSAEAKQKCLAHIGRELKALEGSLIAANRIFAQQVFPILEQARQAHRDYHAGQLTLEQLQHHRLVAEAQLEQVLTHPPKGGWADDAQTLANRFRRHWPEWFTFLSHPEVKPDNNDAERSLRPVVVHRKMSGGSRSHWGSQLVAMMFSFLETMRLQGKNAMEALFNLLANEGRPPPLLESPTVA
ncbi:MAG: IS66 family transposase [Thermosynechococcaceae cyanobacterium]